MGFGCRLTQADTRGSGDIDPIGSGLLTSPILPCGSKRHLLELDITTSRWESSKLSPGFIDLQGSGV